MTDMNTRRTYHPSELPAHLMSAIRETRMAPEHDHLNALMNDAMTTDRFRECITILGWSPHGLAAMLGWSNRMGSQWALGVREIPAEVAAWLEVRAKHAEAHPAPVRGKRG